MCIEKIKNAICYDMKLQLDDATIKENQCQEALVRSEREKKTLNDQLMQTVEYSKNQRDELLKLENENNGMKEQLAQVPPAQIIPSEVLAWDNKYPTANIYYDGRTIPGTKTRAEEDIRHFITPKDGRIHGWVDNRQLWIFDPWNCNDAIAKIYKEDRKSLTYAYDLQQFGIDELWLYPYELTTLGRGDCIALYEEVYTKHGLKKMADLNEGEEVLSYDFNKNEFVHKPITKILEKGELPAKRVYLRNGTHIDMSEEHNLLVRTNQYGTSTYLKTHLKDVDLHLWYKRKMPTAKKIPYEIGDIEWLNEDLCFIIGHFIAEGWVEKSHTSTSGYDCPEIAERLEKNAVPFSEGRNGVPIIRFLKSPFKDFLSTLKTSSFNITLPEEIFHLPENKLRAFLEGYFLGDGHTRGGYKNQSITRDYSTSSEQLAADLQRLHMQIGEPIYSWKQENHQGAGHHPIWRLRDNPNSHFRKDYGHKDLSETSIVSVEDLPPTQMRDIEVKDTNNFVLKNGLVSHNCEDYANLLASRLVCAGLPPERLRVVAGMVNSNEGGHCTVYVLDDDFQTWRHLDSTSSTTHAHLTEFPDSKDLTDRHGVQGTNIWFAFNSKNAWHLFRTDLAETSFNKSKISKRITIEVP